MLIVAVKSLSSSKPSMATIVEVVEDNKLCSLIDSFEPRHGFHINYQVLILFLFQVFSKIVYYFILEKLFAQTGVPSKSFDLNLIFFSDIKFKDIYIKSTTTHVVALEVDICEKNKIKLKTFGGGTNLGAEDFDNGLIDNFVKDLKKKHNKNLVVNAKAMMKLKTVRERAKCAFLFHFNYSRH